MLEWEVVTTDTFSTYRLKVPGGWLYKTGMATEFVPEPAPTQAVPIPHNGDHPRYVPMGPQNADESLDDWLRRHEQWNVGDMQ